MLGLISDEPSFFMTPNSLCEHEFSIFSYGPWTEVDIKPDAHAFNFKDFLRILFYTEAQLGISRESEYLFFFTKKPFCYLR